MKMKFILPLVAFFLIVLLLGVGLTMDPRAIPSTKINKPAPAFQLPLLSDETKLFSPTDMIGQRWILNVWASWCVSCRYEHPILNQMASNGLTIIGLNYKDQPLDAKNWLAERGDPYQHSVIDIQGTAGIDWGVIAVPETFVVDESGTVIYKHTGPITPELAQQEILPLFTSSTTQRAP